MKAKPKNQFAETPKHPDNATRETCDKPPASSTSAPTNSVPTNSAPSPTNCSISLIVARSENKVIGAKGRIPWHCPEDLAHFKALTTGHICLVGYKTWLSLPNRSLPGRQLYCLTRKNLKSTKTVKFVHTIEDFFEKLTAPTGEIFCIGGLQVYRGILPYARAIYLTEIRGIYPGDTIFPDHLLEGFSPRLLRQTPEASYFKYERNC